MGVVGARAAIAVLLAAFVVGGCVRDASRRPAPRAPATPHARDVRASRATFLEAVTRYRRGALDEARPLFRSLLDTYPVLADYHLAYLAAIEERTRHLPEAAALDDRLLQAHPASVWATTSAARRARAALALGDARAAELAERARDLAGDDTDARGVALAVLAALRSETDPRGAYELYQEVRRGGGEAAPTARDASARLEAAHPDLLRDPTLLLAEGRVLAAESRTDLAAVRLEAAADGSDGPERIEALEALGKLEKQAGRLEDAIATYRRAMDLTPTGGMARFELATLYWNRDRDAEARALFTRIAAETPRHPKYDTARYALARIAEQEGRTDEAVAQLRSLAAGEGDLAREARWRLAWMPYRRGDLTAAAEAFAAFGAGDEKDRAAAAYWRGRVLARQGFAAESRDAFEVVLAEAPDGYYADLAERALATTVPPPPAPTPIDSAPPAAFTTTHAYHWERSRELSAMGMTDAAAREIDALVRELPDGDASRPFLLEAYSDVEAHGRALRLAHRIQSSLPAPTFAAYQFPRAYWSRVVQAADGERLDPYVVLALMRQESLFDRAAVSPAAAYGLMQLLVPTAARIAGRPIEASALFDPTTNITLGARYLRQLLDRFEGNLAKALAAYNGGEAAVAKWEQRAPGTTTDEFVETISYRETRHYVKQVLGNYRRYRRLYGAPGEQRALERAVRADQTGADNASADTSFPASPPNPPFDISTTTSPGVT
ncbi:MAG: transglycosylase SLT domain-containing protein [Deltaproteobacteria bacterium]|nr:transglycosylase SLT domain-containing protein [Deltaproteobacteria bacterium]